MKKVIFTPLILLVSVFTSFGQNSPLLIYGNGLNGSTYQMSAIHSDINGLLIEAPKNSSNIKLPIHFNWRDGGTPPLYITGEGRIGLGTTNPTQRLTIANGSICLPNYGYSVAVASPGSNGTTYARLLGTDEANSVDRASLTTNGFVNISNNLVVRDNASLPVWALTLDANNDGFFVKRSAVGSNKLTSLFSVKDNGNVGIGTTNPTAKLTVAGDILAREIRVEANAGADFVFEENYPLKPLKEVEQFIAENKHLPDIAPADTMIQNGVNMGEFQIQLLQKIEELTLYVIKQEKENEELKKQLDIQQKRMEKLEMKIK